MKKLLLLGLMAVSSASFAGTFFYQGDLTANDPRYTNPGGQAGGNQAYKVFSFSVTVSGLYTFETASPNTHPTPTTSSNALDTFIAIYANTFNPGAPGSPMASNDDFTGTLTVLPGPYAGTVLPNGTGFTGAQPASRTANVNLSTGITYHLINTSFRPWNYVISGTQGAGVGHFYQGIGGPGEITPVPEPATIAAVGLGVAAMLRRRKKA